MTAELINRKSLKEEARELLSGAQVSPKAMTALYAGLLLVLNMVSAFTGEGILSTFVSILTSLLSVLLGAGFAMYCMAIRRGERAEYLTLFDGFSFVGKLIALTIVTYAFITLWSMLFVIPGIVAAYRYRFAPYNLYENPGIGVMEALEMSKRQTMGYKGQLLALDLSYIGWTLLASLPAMVEMGMVYYGMFSSYYDYMTGAIAVMPADFTVFALLPAWLWTLISGLWSMAVSLFFLPHFQCVELGYFETAKRTSGVGEGAEPSASNAWGGSGPDGLGGL
ncbi:DUF975 family protein [Oscillibacter sp.]|uniref:DUF975 family protein n=1 Tax=Oscillibacter sp. TaxID=1945593 RepID=UPI001B7AC66E|nr:DUF975 family protein [Oscillibacter sp.]MBP3508512.1 DUF975 family protein [Oscillibacter sp.]